MLPPGSALPLGTPAPGGAPGAGVASGAGAAGVFAGYPVQAHPAQQQQQPMLTTSPPPETQVNNPAVVKTKLEAVPTEGKTPEDVVEEVVRTCTGEGAILSTAKSTRCRDGATDRVDIKKLICTRGGGCRQLEYEARLDTRLVSIRHARTHQWPKISNMKLEHNHVVNREAIDVKLRLAGKLTEERRGQVEKMISKGMKPKAVTEAMKALHEDSDVDINKRAVQNAAASVHGAEKPGDAADAYEEVMVVTADGGVCEIKMDDSGCLTHIWWQSREQVALWNRYGHIALYDDTAVKNRYRMPLGVLAVIDSDYRTRTIGQSTTADITTDTFLWMLKGALRSRGGKRPDIFIQDADAAMTAAVREVFPEALARRCLWHLNQNIMKALAKDLGGKLKVCSTVCLPLNRIRRYLMRRGPNARNTHSAYLFRERPACSCFPLAFMDEFRCVRQQLSLAKLEGEFNALIAKYPQTEKYMRVVYDDRARAKCNSRFSLLDVAKYFSGIICSQKDAAALRDALDHLPPTRMAAPPATAFKTVLESCEFSIAAWPRRVHGASDDRGHHVLPDGWWGGGWTRTRGSFIPYTFLKKHEKQVATVQLP
ncbi:unnamed protein product [Ectocarpus sp. CCAP 1310/34]|nr:unnamed protein product [Ectocarpus sp. CCAP 1310/34]